MVRVHLSPVSQKNILWKETEVSNKVISTNGGVAQLGEHLPCKQGVKSSNLSISTPIISTSSRLVAWTSDCACTEERVEADRDGYLQIIRERETEGFECSGYKVNYFVEIIE